MLTNSGIVEGKECKDCGYAIIYVCCNAALATTKPYSDYEWWHYCSNKTCHNHNGVGVSQDEPQPDFEINEKKE